MRLPHFGRDDTGIPLKIYFSEKILNHNRRHCSILLISKIAAFQLIKNGKTQNKFFGGIFLALMGAVKKRTVFYIRSFFQQIFQSLFWLRSVNRTNISARTTIYALILINYILIVTCRYAWRRTFRLASTTTYTFVVNKICHTYTSLEAIILHWKKSTAIHKYRFMKWSAYIYLIQVELYIIYSQIATIIV